MNEKEKLTHEQKCQIAAMNANGDTVDDIIKNTGIDKANVESYVEERNGKRKTISAETKQAVVKWYQRGNSENMCAKKFDISPASAHRIIASAKEKEPAAAATATDSKEKTVHVKDSTKSPESQALRGVEVIGLMQTMLIGIEENFGDNAEVMSLRADSEQAHIMFRYGGEAYALSFGLAF